jgi:hypothetical protein
MGVARGIKSVPLPFSNLETWQSSAEGRPQPPSIPAQRTAPTNSGRAPSCATSCAIDAISFDRSKWKRAGSLTASLAQRGPTSSSVKWSAAYAERPWRVGVGGGGWGVGRVIGRRRIADKNPGLRGKRQAQLRPPHKARAAGPAPARKIEPAAPAAAA